jgi:hypothetical protein
MRANECKTASRITSLPDKTAILQACTYMEAGRRFRMMEQRHTGKKRREQRKEQGEDNKKRGIKSSVAFACAKLF